MNPYPVRYRPAFACSDILYPLAHRPTLTGGFPASLRGQSGLPRSTRVPLPKGLGPTCAPAARHLRGETIRFPDLAAYLLVHACRIRLDRASRASHDLNRLLDEPGPQRGGQAMKIAFWVSRAARPARSGVCRDRRRCGGDRGERVIERVIVPPLKRVSRASKALSAAGH